MRVTRLIPSWLRRGLEAGFVAALVAIVTLLGSTIGRTAGLPALPAGPAGALLLAPAVLAIGVVTVAYPVAYAATRADAIFGTLTAFLIAADAVAVIVTTPLEMAGIGRSMALGVLAGVLGLGPLVVGLGAGQVLTRLGFGRRAGAVSAAAAGAFGIVVLALASRLG